MPDFVRRFCVLIVAVVALGAMANGAAADAILRPNVFVDGDSVTLGDLFDNVPLDRAGKIVSRAPAPGRSTVVNAEWLKKVARSGGLDWRATSVFDQAVITRNGIPVPAEMIEAEILRALNGQNLPDDPQVEITSGGQQLIVPIGSSADVRVQDVSYESKSQRFTAIVEAPADSPDAQRLRVAGRVHAMIQVPVLARVVNRGEVITASDLTWQRVREEGLRRDIITDTDQIVGLTPRQSLRGGQMISANSLQKPVAVKRGAQVMVVLKSGSMSLTARGRALEQGSVGDVVRVQNLNSNMTIEAVIEGPNLVSVISAPGSPLAN